MKKKVVKIGLTLVISAVLTLTLLYPAIAADNSYSIRVSCIIPALPGQNMPVLREQIVTNIKEQISSPVMFQKDSKETRIIRGEKLLLDVETLYNR